MRSSMKFVLVGLMAALGATLAIAQAENNTRIKVNVPFDFSVGDAMLRAGNYRIQDLQAGALLLKSDDGQVHRFVLTVPDGTADYNHQPRLVFARYGKEVFLDKIFLSSNGNGRELLPGSREKMLIEKRASGEELSLLIQLAR